MNTLTLCRLACSDRQIKKAFGGVYACDTLPKAKRRFNSFIINLDSSNLSGSHWVGIYFEENNDAFYFDSYGIEPLNKHILKFLKYNSKDIFYNKYAFQEDFSITCGEFCLYFLFCRSRHLKLKELDFKNKKRNEIFIKKFIRQNFNHRHNCCYFSFAKSQKCIPWINMQHKRVYSQK